MCRYVKSAFFLLYNSIVSFSFSWTFVRISLFIHFAFDFCFLLLRLFFAKDCLDIYKILMSP